jgi:hypothetical protein
LKLFTGFTIFAPGRDGPLGPQGPRSLPDGRPCTLASVLSNDLLLPAAARDLLASRDAVLENAVHVFHVIDDSCLVSCESRSPGPRLSTLKHSCRAYYQKKRQHTPLLGDAALKTRTIDPRQPLCDDAHRHPTPKGE